MPPSALASVVVLFSGFLLVFDFVGPVGSKRAPDLSSFGAGLYFLGRVRTTFVWWRWATGDASSIDSIDRC
jgi:hypothetical protein